MHSFERRIVKLERSAPLSNPPWTRIIAQVDADPWETDRRVSALQAQGFCVIVRQIVRPERPRATPITGGSASRT